MTEAEIIHNLEKRCFSDPWSLNSVANQLESGSAIWAIISEADTPVGYVLGNVICGEAELYRIAVAESCRKKGYGDRLMTDFLCKCSEAKAEKVFLEVRSQNHAAISLYEKHGFERISVRKNYYGDDDAVIFAKNMSVN